MDGLVYAVIAMVLIGGVGLGGLTIWRFYQRRNVLIRFADQLMASIPEGVLVLDQADGVLMMNEALHQYLPQVRRDVVGKHFSTVFAAYPQFTLDATEVTLEGRYYEVHSATFLQAGQGRILTFHDISEAKALAIAGQEENAFSRALQTTSALLNSSLNPDQVMLSILEAVQWVVPHDFANIMLIDEDRQTAKIAYHRGYPQEMGATLDKTTLSLEKGTSLAPLLEGQPMIVPDTAHYSQWQMKNIVYMVRSYVGVPIRLDEEVIGFLNLDSHQPDTFTPRHAERLVSFANQAAIAIQNARVYDQTRQQKDALNQHVEVLSVILDIYREMNEARPMEFLTNLALDTAVRLSNAEAAYIAISQEDGMRVKQRYGVYNQYIEENSILNAKMGPISRLMENKRAELVSNVFDDPDYTPHLPFTKAQMVIPLLAGSRLVGLINLETANAANFTTEAFGIMQIVASRIAGAIENARLRESLEAQLESQQQLYQEVSNLAQLKSDMIRIAAHDLGNPLSVIRGFLEMLLDNAQNLTESQLESLQKIERGANRMQQIIKDILSLERIERMGQGNTAFRLDMRIQVEQAYYEHLQQAASKRQQFKLDIQSDHTYHVIADSVQLYEAIANLVGNAIKYTPQEGQVTVYLGIEPTQNYIEFKVVDTGYGIPQELQARLFQPFYRAKTPQTKHIDGTGLGLHLVKSIIERQGGELFYTSEEGQGSTFGFRLMPSPTSPLETVP